jgi:hypothetical protein
VAHLPCLDPGFMVVKTDCGLYGQAFLGNMHSLTLFSKFKLRNRVISVKAKMMGSLSRLWGPVEVIARNEALTGQRRPLRRPVVDWD